MMDTKKLFNQIANEILANPIKNSTPQINLGSQLGDCFINKLLNRFKDLEKSEGNLVKVFYKNKRNILSIEFQNAAIKITLNAKIGLINDDKNLLRDVSKIGHWGSGDYQIRLENETYFDDVLELIEQIY
jgi:predicted transport protein